ncbi:MAG: hypothetical protein N2747_10870 [Chitinophagaceae bacterium]|nr:hypothetical protein [Chitinophagaceae bacterium]
MEYLLFIAYLLLFAWLSTRISFFKASGLTSPQIIIVFLLKVMAGIFYGWIGVYYGGLAQMQDTWSLHAESISEYRLLFENPKEYFTNLFRNPYREGMYKFFGSTDSYWNDVKANFIIKIFSLFNIFSQGFYYVNVIFYSFLTLFGGVALFRVMSDAFPTRKTEVMLFSFLIPSFLYWTSGLHKEGLIFTGISLITYSTYFALKKNRWTFRKVILFITGLLLLLFLRNFLIFLILPALAAWMLSHRFPRKSLEVFGITYLISGLLFFTAKLIHPRLDFPQSVVDKQQAFLLHKPGGSTIQVKKLEPHFFSFVRNAPQAFNNSALRPHPDDVKHILSLAAATEINILLLLFLIFFFLRLKLNPPRPFILFSIFFSVSVLLAIGFSVNNLGAIVRYRSVVFPLLFVPLLIYIDWKRIFQLLFNNIKNKNNI